MITYTGRFKILCCGIIQYFTIHSGLKLLWKQVWSYYQSASLLRELENLKKSWQASRSPGRRNLIVIFLGTKHGIGFPRNNCHLERLISGLDVEKKRVVLTALPLAGMSRTAEEFVHCSGGLVCLFVCFSASLLLTSGWATWAVKKMSMVLPTFLFCMEK